MHWSIMPVANQDAQGCSAGTWDPCVAVVLPRILNRVPHVVTPTHGLHMTLQWGCSLSTGSLSCSPSFEHGSSAWRQHLAHLLPAVETKWELLPPTWAAKCPERAKHLREGFFSICTWLWAHQHVHTSARSRCSLGRVYPLLISMGQHTRAQGSISGVWGLVASPRVEGPAEPERPRALIPMERAGERQGGHVGQGDGHWLPAWLVFPQWQTHPCAQVKPSEEEKMVEETQSLLLPMQQAPFGAGGVQGSAGVQHRCTLTLGLLGAGHRK